MAVPVPSAVSNETCVDGLRCPLLQSHTQEEVVVFCRLFISILSFSGSLLMIGRILLFGKYKSFTQRQILYLSIAALLSSVAYISGFRVYYRYTPAFCTWSGFFLLYTDWVLLANTLAITFNLTLEISFHYIFRWFEIAHMFFSFGLPLLIGLYPYIYDYYGPSGAWCWIRSVNENCASLPDGKSLQFSMWYGPLYFINILLLCILIILIRKYNQWKSQQTYDQSELQTKWRKEIGLLLQFSFVSLLSFFPALNRLWQNAEHEANFIFILFHVLTAPLTGAVMAVIFSIDEKTLQKLHLQYTSAMILDGEAEIRRLSDIILLRDQAVKKHQESLRDKAVQTDLPGKEVMDKTVFLRLEDGPFDCHWKGFGMRLHVPKEAAGSIRSITVEVVRANKIQLPANTELVSPVFWIEAEGILDQPATLELQHWGLITREEQCCSLSFVMCRSITEALPQFELCCEGSFSSTSNYGKLKVNDFHFFGIIRKLLSADLVEPSYAAKVFYECDDKLTGAFVVLPQHDMYCTKMSQYHNCSKDTAQFTFNGESVCLGICGESVPNDLTENEGWKIVSPSNLKVSRAVVEEDSLAIICNPCKFELEWKGESEPQALQKFVLQGSKGPKHMSMNVPPSARPQVVDSKNRRQQEKSSFTWLQKFTALLLFLSATVLTLVLLYLWSGSAKVPCEPGDHLVKNENDLYSWLEPVSNLKPLALHLGIRNHDLDAAEKENPSNMQDLNIDICDLLFRRLSELSWCEILDYLFSNKECRTGKEIAKAKGIKFFSVQAYQEHCRSSRTDL